MSELHRYWAWRTNSGLTVLPASGPNTRRVVKGAPGGTPDIFVVLRGGRLVGLEVKTATGKLRPSQEAWAARAERHGVPYAVVRGVFEALTFVKRVENGHA